MGVTIEILKEVVRATDVSDLIRGREAIGTSPQASCTQVHDVWRGGMYREEHVVGSLSIDDPVVQSNVRGTLVFATAHVFSTDMIKGNIELF